MVSKEYETGHSVTPEFGSYAVIVEKLDVASCLLGLLNVMHSFPIHGYWNASVTGNDAFYASMGINRRNMFHKLFCRFHNAILVSRKL